MANLDFSGVYFPPGGLRADLEFVPATAPVIDAVLLADGGVASAVISTSLRRGIFAEISASSGSPSCSFTAVSIVDGALAGSSPAAGGDVSACIVLDASISASSARVVPALSAAYNLNVWRGSAARPSGAWKPAATCAPVTSGPWQATAALRTRALEPWQAAARVSAGAGVPWSAPPSVRAAGWHGWQVAAGRKLAMSVPFADLAQLRAAPAVRHQVAAAVASSLAAPWIQLLRVHRHRTAAFELARQVPALRLAPWQVAGQRHRRCALRWQEGRTVSGPGVWVPWPVDPVDPPYVGDPNLEFCLDIHQVTTDLDFAYPCGRPVVDEPDVIPILRAYVMTASVLLERVAGSLELPVLACSIALDAGTSTWGIEVTLPERELAKLGEREPLRLTINGHPLLWLAERWSVARSFGTSRVVRLSGRSVHAELDAPLWPASSGVVAAPTNARQLAEQALANTGYTLDWQLPDWLVPAGAWSWEGLTPLARVARVAEAAGGRVLGKPGSRVLLARLDYPHAPWEWQAQVPHLQLPEAALETLSADWDETPAVNAVIVSGERAGVTARVRRAGSAGDKLAQTVIDPLVTHQDAARSRGTGIIAASGRACRVQVVMPLLAEQTRLLLPGDLVSVTGADPFRSLVRGVRVSAERKGALVVRQQLDLERRA